MSVFYRFHAPGHRAHLEPVFLFCGDDRVEPDEFLLCGAAGVGVLAQGLGAEEAGES